MESQNDDGIVELISVQGEIEANVVRGVLRAEGIETMTRGEAAHSVHPITVDGMGRITIYVREEDLVKARVVLKEYEER